MYKILCESLYEWKKCWFSTGFCHLLLLSIHKNNSKKNNLMRTLKILAHIWLECYVYFCENNPRLVNMVFEILKHLTPHHNSVSFNLYLLMLLKKIDGSPCKYVLVKWFSLGFSHVFCTYWLPYTKSVNTLIVEIWIMYSINFSASLWHL